MRIFLSLFVLLVGLFTVQRFATHTSENHLTLHGAHVVSEEDILDDVKPVLLANVSEIELLVEVRPATIAIGLGASRVRITRAAEITATAAPKSLLPQMAAPTIDVGSIEETVLPSRPSTQAVTGGARTVTVLDVDLPTILAAVTSPLSACEQLWDHSTHMTQDEWASACRRVDEDRRGEASH